MGKLKKRLKASTLVESLVSMVLIVIILGSSFTAMTAITKSTMNSPKFRAAFIIRELLSDDVLPAGIDTLWNDGNGFEIISETSSYGEYDSLAVVTVKAVAPGDRVIYTAKRIIIANSEK